LVVEKRVENQLKHIGPHNSQNNPQPIIEVSKFQIIPSVPQKPNGLITPKIQKKKKSEKLEDRMTEITFQ